MRRKGIILAVAGVSLAFALSVALDRAAGVILNRSGYFSLMRPGKNELYDTAEFTVAARVSSQGLRNPVVAVPKPGDTYRILAVGDSFTYGWGVDEPDTWVRLLEQKLRETLPAGKRVELVNAGAPGLGIDGYIDACESYAGRFSADAVIVGLYGTDDLYQAASTKQNETILDSVTGLLWPTLSRIATPVIIDSWYVSGPGGKNIVMSQAWSVWVKNYFIANPTALSRLEPQIRNMLLAGKVNPSLLRGAMQDPQYLVKLLDDKNFSYARASAKTLLSLLKTRCTGSRPVLVVYLPSSETISDFFFPYRTAFGFQADPRLITFRPDEAVGTIAQELGFSYVSALPKLRQDTCISCFYPWDIHLTKEGNQKIADILSDYIINKRLFGLSR